MTQDFEMMYLKDFQTQLFNHDYAGLIRLWEEYCLGDEVEVVELRSILNLIKSGEFAAPFGKYVEKILPLWEKLPETPDRHSLFKLIIDMQTSNHEQLRQYILDYLQHKYGSSPDFNETIRLIGLKTKENFQGAVSHFELVHNMHKGKFVFHKGGWGTGQILDVSKIREQLTVEFEHVLGKKDISFINAFNTLISLPDDHFLAQRFGNPDQLEIQAKSNPLNVIHHLLRDLGPKTASEIKDELCELVIPEKDWAKWWQNARVKMKKDTLLQVPEDLHQPFILRNTEISHEEKLQQFLDSKPDVNDSIQTLYTFTRDFPETLKNPDFKLFVQNKIHSILKDPVLTDSQIIQLNFFLDDLSLEKNQDLILSILKRISSTSIPSFIQSIPILAFKKRVLTLIHKCRSDWKELFLNLLLTIDQNTLRDYLFQELSEPETREDLKNKINDLAKHPDQYPEACVWYFQKILQAKDSLFDEKMNKPRFFEAFFIVLNKIEQSPNYRDLLKKMHHLLTHDRYAVVRDIMQHSSIEQIQEFLLLASKCYSLSDHDLKIFHSLAEVIYPSLANMRKKQDHLSDEHIIWTTEKGYQKLKDRIQHIATVETVQNAKEIELARSHGDLRENAEFKASLEKRDRLQMELKTLSDQLSRSRILTKNDVTTNEVGVGCVVECQNSVGDHMVYVLLGPWDADPEKGILSFQSKLAQKLQGLSIGGRFSFQGEEYTITKIRNYFDG